MRTFWQIEFPVGDPCGGAAFGERCDPNAIDLGDLSKGMSGVGTIAGGIGNLMAGSASRKAGEAQRAEALFEAEQLRQNAGQTVASSQRDAAEQRRRAAIVASRALAVSAASGGGASDPTVAGIIADIEGRGSYNAAVALYQGEDKARLLRMGADAKVYEGEIMAQGGRDRQTAYNLAAFGGMATGGASMYAKYGRGGPKAKAATESDGWLDAGTEGYSTIG